MLAALLILSMMALVGMVVSAILVSRAQDRTRRHAQRVSRFIVPFRALAPSLPTTIKPRVAPRRPVMDRVLGWLHLDLTRKDLYPVSWWVVPVGAAIPVLAVLRPATHALGMASAVVMPLGWLVLCRFIFGTMIDRRRTRQLEQFPDALAMIVRSVGVGVSIAEAMRMVSREAPSPTSEEFSRLFEQVVIGVSMEDALHDLATRAGLAEYRFFATALVMQAQTGGAISASLDGLADVIRKRLALKRRGHALASEARASATVLGILPVALGLLLFVSNPAYIRVLFTDPVGHILLAAAAGSLGCGIMVMRAIIRRTLS